MTGRSESELEVVDVEAYRRYTEMLSEHLTSYYGSCLGLSDRAVALAIDKRIVRERGTQLAEFLDELVGLDGKKLLDVGSGWGELAFACAARGAEATGIEPDAEEVRISELLFESFGLDGLVSQGAGERLPYPDAHFDLVTCQQVLEHVSDVNRVVAELVRVTKPGGQIFVSTPNYLFPYEGHYRMKWIPLFPKKLGARLLKSKGRDPTFLLHHINYTNYFQLSRLWKRHRLIVRNLTAERVISGSHPGAIYRRPVIGSLIRRLRLYPNISWLLTKP